MIDLDAPEEQMTIPCPACPDGNRWTSEGPKGVCPVCKGHAVIFPGQEREDD